MSKEEEAKTLLRQGIMDIATIARKTGVSIEWLEGQRRWI